VINDVLFTGAGSVNPSDRLSERLKYREGQSDAAPAQTPARRPEAGPGVSSETECITLTDPAAAPRKLRDRKPELSNDLRKIQTHGGVLIYQVRIGASGDVTEVRLVKAVDTKEPWPTLAKAWRAAILEWRYVPTIMSGRPVAVCLTATVTIDVM
jgi:hypothetical protein